jgi:hypothetical protein
MCIRLRFFVPRTARLTYALSVECSDAQRGITVSGIRLKPHPVRYALFVGLAWPHQLPQLSELVRFNRINPPKTFDSSEQPSP